MYAGTDGDQVRMAIECGLKLSIALKDDRYRCRLLSDLIILLSRMGDFRAALKAAEECLAVAQSMDDVAEEATATWLLAATLHFAGGDHATTLRYCERGIALASDAKDGAAGSVVYNLRLRGTAVRARSLWMLGMQEQAATSARETFRAAYRERFLATSCVIMVYATQVLVWSGEVDDASDQTEVVLGRAREFALAPYVASCLALKGELMVRRGQVVEGVEVLRDALKGMSATQYRILVPSTLRALAEGLVLCGNLGEALLTIDWALESAIQTGAELWISDLLRTRGEILLVQSNPDPAVAESVLHSAIYEARKRQALSWELKAAVPLARMLSDQGRKSDAHAILGGIYDRFSEGFGHPDLVSARTLLATL
jgi:tetratricopeptide (TPR) repeat protein